MKILYFITTMILSLSCVDHTNLHNQSEKNDTTLTKVSDTLKFTTGIRSILQDSKGHYWFGSDQEGVCRYDGKTFTYFTTDNGFCGKQVLSIKEDETGRIWFGTSSGLCYFDGINFISFPQQYDYGVNTINRYSAWSKHKTDIWFSGASRNELITIDKGVPYTLKNPIIIPPNTDPRNYDITGFTKSKRGGLWIAYYAGVAYYDGNTTYYINDSTVNFDGKSKYMHVRSIAEDSHGRLWIGNNGIGVQLKENDSIYHFSEKYHVINGEIFSVKSPPGTLMHVFAIKEDSKGNIWFGDRDTGIWRFDGKKLQNFPLDASLSTYHIWDIYEDKKGNVLFASGDRGVYTFNGNGFTRVF